MSPEKLISETINAQAQMVMSLLSRLNTVEGLIPPGYLVGNDVEGAVRDVVAGLKEMTAAARNHLVALEEAENVIDELRCDRDSWRETADSRQRLLEERPSLGDATVNLHVWKSRADILSGENEALVVRYESQRAVIAELREQLEAEKRREAGRRQHEEMLQRKRDEADTRYASQCQTIVKLEKKLAHWNKVASKLRGMVSEGELDGPPPDKIDSRCYLPRVGYADPLLRSCIELRYSDGVAIIRYAGTKAEESFPIYTLLWVESSVNWQAAP